LEAQRRSSGFARQEAGTSCTEFPSRSLGTRKIAGSLDGMESRNIEACKSSITFHFIEAYRL